MNILLEVYSYPFRKIVFNTQKRQIILLLILILPIVSILGLPQVNDDNNLFDRPRAKSFITLDNSGTPSYVIMEDDTIITYEEYLGSGQKVSVILDEPIPITVTDLKMIITLLCLMMALSN